MKTISKMLFTLVLVLLAAMGWISVADAERAPEALFINVGKADATLLWVEDQCFLVDTGTKGSFDSLWQALTIYQVQRLNGVVITHTDKDHVGGLKKLLKSGIQIDAVYGGTLFSEEDAQEHPAYTSAMEFGVPFVWLEAGDSITVGESVFQVLGPLTLDTENENNNSLVINLQTPHGNILLTGDMELEEEAELMDKQRIPSATVLKVAHHGEDDATSKRFVLTVKPQWAVIFTSTEEEADTPDSKIMSRLWEGKAGIAVTQEAQIGILVTLHNGVATAERIDLQ